MGPAYSRVPQPPFHNTQAPRSKSPPQTNFRDPNSLLEGRQWTLSLWAAPPIFVVVCLFFFSQMNKLQLCKCGLSPLLMKAIPASLNYLTLYMILVLRQLLTHWFIQSIYCFVQSPSSEAIYNDLCVESILTFIDSINMFINCMMCENNVVAFRE